MVVSLTDGKSLTIPCPNSLGLVHMPDGSQVGMQEAIDRVYMELLRDYTDCRQLWDLESVRRWGKAPATDCSGPAPAGSVPYRGTPSR